MGRRTRRCAVTVNGVPCTWSPARGEVSPVVTHSEDEKGPGPAEQAEPGSSTQPLASSDGPPDEKDELQRQREALAELHQQVDTRAVRQRRVTVLRQIVAAVLVFVAALGVTMSAVSYTHLTLPTKRI